MHHRSIFLGVLLIVFGAHDAASQGFISPFVGTTLTSPSSTGSSTKPGFGIAFGAVGRIVGVESEIAFYPEVIDNAANALSKSKVISFSGGPILGPTIGPVKPYAAFGFGNLHLNVTGISSVVVPNPESISNNYFTFNYGGGVMGFFTDHFGVRGDLRYYRAFGIKIEDLEKRRPSAGQVQFLARQLWHRREILIRHDSGNERDLQKKHGEHVLSWTAAIELITAMTTLHSSSAQFAKHSRWANAGRAGRPVGTTRERAQKRTRTEHVVRTVANSNNST